MFDFFRKESPRNFGARFSRPATDECALSSQLVFQASNADGIKRFTIRFGGQSITLKATVANDCKLRVQNDERTPTPRVNLTLTEADLAEALATSALDADERPISYWVARQLCIDHAASSRSSPFISGCPTNNFSRATAYEGYKFHIQLRSRQPFINPFLSGRENECFLIGRVSQIECAEIRFLGTTQEEGIDVVVDPFVG